MGCSSTNNVSTDIHAVKFEYEGHSYIQFDAGGVSGYVHDPDCWCMVEYD